MQLGSYTLRPYQVAAVDAARDEVGRLMRAGLPPRVLVVAPCGAGKTIMSSALIAGALAKGRSAMFMASGRQLINQKSERLAACGITHAVLMANSGAEFFHSGALVASKDTYASRVLKNQSISAETRDLWIVDECHRSLGGEWQAILPPSDDRETVVVGFTATPALANGCGLGSYYNGIVRAASYRQLIADGVITPCRVYAPFSVDTSGVKRSSDGDWNWKQLETRQKRLVGKVVEKWKELGEGRPTVCFAQGVEHSIGLCQEFNGAGVASVHVDANTPEDDRQAAYRGLRDGSIKVVTNFGVLTTGWDEPCVSCGILAFATDSLIKLLQTSGRVLRSYPGKSDAIIIDHGDNIRRHGWPTEDHDWSLDGESKIAEREAKAKAEKGIREPICCPKCGAMRENGPKCPNCGHQHQRSGIKVYNEDGELVELKPRQAKEERKQDDTAKTWMKCLAIAARRNGNFWVARQMFERITGQSAAYMRPMPEQHELNLRVGVKYPGFLGRKKNAG